MPATPSPFHRAEIRRLMRAASAARDLAAAGDSAVVVRLDAARGVDTAFETLSRARAWLRGDA